MLIWHAQSIAYSFGRWHNKENEILTKTSLKHLDHHSTKKAFFLQEEIQLQTEWRVHMTSFRGSESSTKTLSRWQIRSLICFTQKEKNRSAEFSRELKVPSIFLLLRWSKILIMCLLGAIYGTERDYLSLNQNLYLYDTHFSPILSVTVLFSVKQCELNIHYLSSNFSQPVFILIYSFIYTLDWTAPQKQQRASEQKLSFSLVSAGQARQRDSRFILFHLNWTLPSHNPVVFK